MSYIRRITVTLAARGRPCPTPTRSRHGAPARRSATNKTSPGAAPLSHG
jgi:hypothetical protein